MGGVFIVEAGDAAQRATPTAKDQCRAGIFHWERQPTEKVGSIDPAGLERDFVVLLRQVLAGPADAGQSLAGGKDQTPLIDARLASAGKVSILPLPQRFAIKQGLFRG